MATPESIAIRRAEALERVAKAIGTIATATGAEIPERPQDHKQLVIRPAIEAEWFADALEAIAGRTAERTELFRAEIDNLTAAWQEAEAKLEAARLPTSKDVTPDLSRMNRNALNDYAASIGVVDVEGFATKAELIAAIEALPK